MSNKFLRIDYFSPYIIWCADSLLSVISSLFSFLFFHYLMKVSVDSELQQKAKDKPNGTPLALYVA